MASIATVYNRVFQKSAEFGEETARVRTAPGLDESARVRAFANEDIYFWVKRIENGRVVRRADPAASGMCWKLIGTAVAAAVLLIAVLLPSAYGLLAGYQIQTLQEESLRLNKLPVIVTRGGRSEAVVACAAGRAGADAAVHRPGSSEAHLPGCKTGR